MTSGLETYLARLRFELRKRGLVDARIVEEACGHLTDATEQGIQHGLSPDAAERNAISQFGAPEVVAEHFAPETHRARNRLVFLFAFLFGLAAAYLTSRPGWENAGVTAVSMLLAAGLFRLCVAVRRMLANGALRSHGPRSEFHVRDRDRSAAWHYLVKSKRGWVNPELVAIASDPDALLVPFLERIAPVPLGPLGEMQSLTLIEDGSASARHVKTYRAIFGKDRQVACTVSLGSNGQGFSVDWMRPGPAKV